MIRVLIAEDRATVPGALATLLDLEGDISVVAQVGNGEEALAAAAALHPDIALLDTEMTVGEGIETAARLHRAEPDCVILLLTPVGRPGFLRRAMEAGASGFIVKDGPAAELAETVRRAGGGERVLDPTLAAAALSAPNPLTERERDVLGAASDGSGIAAIATALLLSEGAVRNFLSTAIHKTGARDRMEAVRRAQAAGWL